LLTLGKSTLATHFYLHKEESEEHREELHASLVVVWVENSFAFEEAAEDAAAAVVETGAVGAPFDVGQLMQPQCCN